WPPRSRSWPCTGPSSCCGGPRPWPWLVWRPWCWRRPSPSPPFLPSCGRRSYWPPPRGWCWRCGCPGSCTGAGATGWAARRWSCDTACSPCGARSYPTSGCSTWTWRRGRSSGPSAWPGSRCTPLRRAATPRSPVSSWPEPRRCGAWCSTGPRSATVS
ncbi:MAG: hypothetical protein AVDCRST_MAG76-3756, partial [uncultured Acidimicrobiales bacterium]